jgi:hypothetical protein
MRRLRTILLLAPVLVAVLLWARSFWRYDFWGARGWSVGSESGAVYLLVGDVDAGYVSWRLEKWEKQFLADSSCRVRCSE